MESVPELSQPAVGAALLLSLWEVRADGLRASVTSNGMDAVIGGPVVCPGLALFAWSG